MNKKQAKKLHLAIFSLALIVGLIGILIDPIIPIVCGLLIFFLTFFKHEIFNLIKV